MAIQEKGSWCGCQGDDRVKSDKELTMIVLEVKTLKSNMMAIFNGSHSKEKQMIKDLTSRNYEVSGKFCSDFSSTTDIQELLG